MKNEILKNLLKVSQSQILLNNKTIIPKILASQSKAYFAQHYLGYDLVTFQYEIVEKVIPENKDLLITVSPNTGKTQVLAKTQYYRKHFLNLTILY